jgi:adenylate kinase
MHTKIIFVGGIHGVGKGTLCALTAAKSGFIHLTASGLIKWHEVSADVNNKLVERVQDTQDRLINGLKSNVIAGNRYLLDGHFCLLNKLGRCEKVPVDTFQKISPSAIVLITASLKEIIKRLEKRDGTHYSIDQLKQLQEKEVEYAKEISDLLQIPFIEIQSGDLEKMIDFLNLK